MIKSKHYLIIILLLTLTVFSYGQEVVKTISYGDEYEILSVEESENYFVSRVMKSTTRDYTIYLYDNDGNELFMLENFESSVMQAFISEELGFLIVIISGNSAHPDIPETPDRIRAFDLLTGDLLWEANSNAEKYLVSPDNTKLLTYGGAVDRNSPLQIIDLTSGNILHTDENFYGPITCWVTNDRIGLLQQPRKQSDEYAQLKERYRQCSLDIQSYYAEIKVLRNDYKNNIITKAEYDEQSKVYSDLSLDKRNEKREISLQLSTFPARNRYVRTAAKLLIYDLSTKNVISETEIYSSDSKPVFVSQFLNSTIGPIGVNNNGRIYFGGFYIDENKNRYATINQFDQDLSNQKSNTIGLLRSHSIKKLITDDELYWIINHRDKSDEAYDFNSNKMISLSELQTSITYDVGSIMQSGNRVIDTRKKTVASKQGILLNKGEED